jgi:hypothetical protein
VGFFCPRKQRPQYELYWKYAQNIIIPDLSDPRVTQDLLNSLIRMGQSIAVGNMPDGEEMDRAVAAAYGFPIHQIRMALAPDTMKAARAKFRRLAERWTRETGMLSSITAKVKHPAYQEIISMGEEAVPFILRALRQRRDFWFEALRRTTGENPVRASEAKDPSQVADAWLEWGQEKGYLD